LQVRKWCHVESKVKVMSETKFVTHNDKVYKAEDNTVTVHQLGEWFKEKRITGEFMTTQLRFLLGKVLTIVDSSVLDTRQNKAMKDIIKGEFLDIISRVSDIVSEGKDILAPDDFDPENPDNYVDEDIALGIK